MIVSLPFGSQREDFCTALVSSVVISRAGVFNLCAFGNYLRSNSQLGICMPSPHPWFIWSGFLVFGLDAKCFILSYKYKSLSILLKCRFWFRKSGVRPDSPFLTNSQMLLLPQVVRPLVLKLRCALGSLDKPQKYLWFYPTTRDSDLVGGECGLGTGSFKSSPGVSDLEHHQARPLPASWPRSAQVLCLVSLQFFKNFPSSQGSLADRGLTSLLVARCCIPCPWAFCRHPWLISIPRGRGCRSVLFIQTSEEPKI